MNLRRAPAAAIRTVEVLPPSRRDEGTWVSIFAAFIVLCSIYIIAFERQDLFEAAAPAQMSYQVLFRDLPSSEQRMFRDIQEGTAEALSVRARTGKWPSVETLAAEKVPPFAPDVLDKSGLVWVLRQDGLSSEYFGLSNTPKQMPTFMISILEPDPTTGEKASTATMTDEEHRLLGDGTLLHVTFWKNVSERIPADVVFEPALAGWTQIRMTDPFEELNKKR